MSLLLDVVKKNSQEKNEKKISFSEGIQFTDANKKKVVVSVDDGLLKLSIFERGSDQYFVSDMLLKKDFIPVLGKILLDFYENGNLKESQKKLGLGEEKDE